MGLDGQRRPGERAAADGGGRGRAYAGAVVLAIVATVVTVLAYVLMKGGCDYYRCHRDVMYDVQFAVACVGLIPVFALLWATAAGRPRAGGLALLLTIGCYATWGVLAGLALHG